MSCRLATNSSMKDYFATGAIAALEQASQEEAPSADIHLRLVQILKLALLGVEGTQLHRTHQMHDRELQSAPYHERSTLNPNSNARACLLAHAYAYACIH